MAKQLSENHALLALLGNYEEEENLYGHTPKAKQSIEKNKESSQGIDSSATPKTELGSNVNFI